ncbi:MAG: hypothetical protein IPQ03_15460 [Bacteroidetes bacterium]|nr:hypothetical protein [Bacteroidota bacterium]MBK9523535.1 hypothetical protein [Bacteroidota bacterium]MBK9541281.1 hypothetical protein [Bacteroidota bacterium]MBL0258837.1 hypothetical protein [Bacteroidota bacterium]MBP6401146.1 hypothetical protein [Bacteroidia bacterium]
MKTLFSIIACLSLLFLNGEANAKFDMHAAKSDIVYEMMQPCTLVVTIAGTLHKKSAGCTDFALGCLHFGVSFNSIIIGEESTELGLEMRSSNVVSLSAYYTEKINTPYFEVEEDTPLGDKLSNQLGYSSIIIKKGLYKYTRDKSNLVTVDLSCASKK